MNIFTLVTKYSRVLAGITSLRNGGRQRPADDAEKVHVDLQEYVVDYVWPKFLNDYRYPRRFFMTKKNYIFDISWNHLEFRDRTEIEGFVDIFAKVNSETKKTQEVDTNDEGTVKEQYLTEYTNISGREQIYEFKHSTEKYLKSTLELQTRYTRGHETNLTVDIFNISELSESFSAVFTVTGTAVAEFSELSRFENATKIKVPPNKQAIAVLQIREKQIRSRFKVTTTVRPYDPNEGLPVTVRKKQNGEVVFRLRVANLHQLFHGDNLKDCRKIVKLETIQKIFDNEKLLINVLRLTTRGVCTVVAPKTQNINVTYKAVPKIKK